MFKDDPIEQAAEQLPAAKLQEYRDIFLYFDRWVTDLFKLQKLSFYQIARAGAGCIGADDLSQV